MKAFHTKPKGPVRGWMTSMSDMFLLAECDTLVAGMRSTFTQILPLSLVFAVVHSPANTTSTTAATAKNRRAPWKFCEADGYRLTCFRDRQAWLFRQDTALRQGRIRTIRITNDSSSSSGVYKASDHQPVVHKVGALPDVPQPVLRRRVLGIEMSPPQLVTNQDLPRGDRINQISNGKI
jgi:hypothetical protein